MTWVDLGDLMLNKAYQSGKTTSQVLPYPWNLRHEGRMHTQTTAYGLDVG